MLDNRLRRDFQRHRNADTVTYMQTHTGAVTVALAISMSMMGASRTMLTGMQ